MAVPKTEVELMLSAKNLKNRDLGGTSDPACVLYLFDNLENKFTEIGRTEVIKNDCNPIWSTRFKLDFFFEMKQTLRFDIYDWDSKSSDVKKQDSLGSVTVSLAEIMASQDGCKKDLEKGSHQRTLIILGTEIHRETVTLEFSATKLDKKDFLGKSDPFLVINRKSGDGFTPVHKTPYIKNKLDPHWEPMFIPLGTLCGGDYKCPLKIECFDWDSDGSHDLIGELITSLETLMAMSSTSYSLINPKKQGKKKYEDSGKLNVIKCDTKVERSFLNYMKGGTQIHFTVAIDFTASNGDPKNPNSLHYCAHGVDNQYVTAIKAVGEIVQEYDSDRMFPALGFGGRIPPNGIVSHDFFLNGNPENPYCNGIEGVLAAYMHSLSTVTLYGPTNFAPLIRHVMKFATSHQDGSSYFVLLIITDGLISDFHDTKKALVEASHLPMSVIIVAVGSEDFTAMELLDGDTKKLSCDGVFAERDIVQFVEFRNYASKSESSAVVKSALAKDVLAEIPQQFLDWMTMRGIEPKTKA